MKYYVTLISAGESPLLCTKIIKEYIGISLTEAKELCYKTPSVILKGVSKAIAEEIAAKLREVGASVKYEAYESESIGDVVAKVNKGLTYGKGRDGYYAVGDFYDRDGDQGIVIYINYDEEYGTEGTILSLTESVGHWSEAYPNGWCLPSESCFRNCIFKNYGKINKTIKRLTQKTDLEIDEFDSANDYWTSDADYAVATTFECPILFEVNLSHASTKSIWKHQNRAIRTIKDFQVFRTEEELHSEEIWRNHGYTPEYFKGNPTADEILEDMIEETRAFIMGRLNKL